MLNLVVRKETARLEKVKRQVINLSNCGIWFVDSFECMMMHGLANPKFKNYIDDDDDGDDNDDDGDDVDDNDEIGQT
jgi:hypothetical protein